MARWFRRDNPANEAKDYIKATDNVSRPMAILLTLLTIVILAALLFTVFWGVKWAYDRIWGDDEITVITTPSDQNNPENQQQEFPAFVNPDQGDTNTNQGNSSSTSQNNTSSTQSSGTGSNPSTIPNTGPSEE